MANKKARTFALSLSILGVIGALAWCVFRPRPLHIKLNTWPDLQRPIYSNHDPFDVDLSTQLSGDLPSPGHTISASLTWSLRSLQYRKSAADAWHDVPIAKDFRRTPVHLLQSGSSKISSNIVVINYDKPGDWKYVVRVDTEMRTLLSRWHGSDEHQFQESVTSAELRQRTQKRAQIKRDLKRIASQTKPQTEQAPPGSVALAPGKRYIARVQWSNNAGTTWHDAPTDGSPMIFSHYESIGFRAVKAAPKTEWPDFPDYCPTWSSDGEQYFGDTIYLHMSAVSRDATDVRTFQARCGNQVTAHYI